MLSQEDQINIELIKKIMTKKKTTLPSCRSQDNKKIKVETKNVNKLLTNIQSGHITEVNELNYVGGKLVCDKEPEQKYKMWNLARMTDKENATTSKDTKKEKIHRDMLRGKNQNITADKSDDTTWGDK